MRNDFDGNIILDEGWKKRIPENLQDRIVLKTENYLKEFNYIKIH